MCEDNLPNELVWPEDESRQHQLRLKLTEYEERLDKWQAPELQAELGNSLGICKAYVLGNLAQSGRLSYSEESTKMLKAIGDHFRPSFDQAWLIIADYILTGGASVRGGTGLPQIDPQTAETNAA